MIVDTVPVAAHKLVVSTVIGPRHAHLAPVADAGAAEVRTHAPHFPCRSHCTDVRTVAIVQRAWIGAWKTYGGTLSPIEAL